MTGFTVRRYTADDIDSIIALQEKFLFSDRDGFTNHFKGIEVSNEKLYNILRLNVKNIKFFTNLVTTEDGKIVGLLSAQVQEYYFSKECLAADMCFFFDPDHTNLAALKELINSYVQWATNRQVREVQLRTSTGFKQDKFGLLMKRIGFSQFETGYSKEIS